MIKINSVQIKGLRGIKDEIDFDLAGKSLLLYGNNGTGKSSITDAFEWFYHNRIDHLANREIDFTTSMRNKFLAEKEMAYVRMSYTNNALNCEKTLSEKKAKENYSNPDAEFLSYLEKSKKETFVLRYSDMVRFIIASKKDRLHELSAIIGYSDVTKMRSELYSTYNTLCKEEKNKGYDNRISLQQAKIIEKLNENITSDAQYFKAIEREIKAINIDKVISTYSDIDEIMNMIKTPEDSQLIEVEASYGKIIDLINQLVSSLETLTNTYSEFHRIHTALSCDASSLKKLKLQRLLIDGLEVLEKNIIEGEICPLCLQSKQKVELIDDIKKRLAELKKYQKEIDSLNELRKDLKKEVNNAKLIYRQITNESAMKITGNKNLLSKVSSISELLIHYENRLQVEIFSDTKLTEPEENTWNDVLQKAITECKSKQQKIGKDKKGNVKFEIASKIENSKDAFTAIKQITTEREVLRQQIDTLKSIYNEFVEKQRNCLQQFLDQLTEEINKTYVFMNPNENITDIKIVPVEKKEELDGLTLNYRFYGSEESPPHMYLSESHLNCLGIAFYLTSVIAFNKTNQFFILDDVISSFDTQHRLNFARLLIDKFRDYQIIMLTHERDWYELMKQMVKGKNWIVKEIKWHETEGPYLDLPLLDQRTRIENKINAGDDTGLGNDIRIYLEHLLKDIVYNLEAKVKFQYNDQNEKRMAYELLTVLKSRINKSGSEDCANIKNAVQNVLDCSFVANIASHDSNVTVNIDDLTVVWKEIKNLENNVFCMSCNSFIAIRHYDDVNKQIRCKCGKIALGFKK